jgi:DNA topoisomerase-6 subunit A
VSRKKATRTKKTASALPGSVNDKEVLGRLSAEADSIHKTILREQKPRMLFPVRSLSNVRYVKRNKNEGYFQIKGRKSERTLTVNTAKTFAQSIRTMAMLKEVVETGDIIGKREVYYNSKPWAECRYDEQPEADTVLDDLEAMFGVNREQFKLVPEERGGDVVGELVVIDTDRATGERLRIDCTKFGSGAYSIPSQVEELGFETKAKFILVVETGQLFNRLNHHAFWKTANCIVISMGGVPTRACRRFIRRLADARKLPVYVFTDGDPYGYGNIYRTLKVGSGNAAHLNEYFCVPQARFLGVTPWDIEEFDLHEATHPLAEVDIKRARDALKNDPFIKNHAEWQKALNKMLEMGVRVEQQAFAKHGLNFVINTYLPKKLANPKRFLP